MSQLQEVQYMKPDRVVESNMLARGRYGFNLPETRVFLSIIAQVEPDDPADKEYVVNLPTLMKYADSKNKNLYQLTRNASYALQGKVVDITPPEAEEKELISLFHKIKYHTGTGTIKAIIHSDLIEHVKALKDNFTQYDLKHLLRVPSANSISIYRLLKSHQWHGKSIEFELEHLKDILTIGGKYTRYYDFKREVLEKAKEHLKKFTDITFSFEPSQKKGKAVTHIMIFIHGNQPLVPLVETGEPSKSNLEKITEKDVYYKKALPILSKCGLTVEDITQIGRYCDNNFKYIFLKAVEVTKRVAKSTDKVKFPKSYVIKAIRSDYSITEIQRLMVISEDEVNKQKGKQGSQEEVRKQQIKKEVEDTFKSLREDQIRMLKETDLLNDFTSFVDGFKQDKGQKHIFISSLTQSVDTVTSSGDIFTMSNVSKMLFFPEVAKKYLPSKWHSLEEWQEGQPKEDT